MSAKPALLGSLVTLSGIAFAAYVVADVAHEGLGHGGACLAHGGKLIFVSTTNEDCSIRARAIDAAGPGVGIAAALLVLAWLRLVPPRAAPLRIFLSLVFAFAIFWNVGYMIESGLLGRGDWSFVIAGLQPGPVWRAALVVGGIVFYIAAMRALSAVMESRLEATQPPGLRPSAFAFIAFLSALVLAGGAGFFDPQGRARIFTDALPSALASIGLVLVGTRLNARLPDLRLAVPRSPLWIAAGLVAAMFFVFVLGPGLRF